MNASLKSFFRQRIPIACFLIGYLLFAAFKHKDYGITWDEYIVYMGGYWLYQDITGHPQAILRDDSEAPGSPHYDQLYPLCLYALNQKLTIPGFHLSNMVFAGSILAAGYESVLPLCLNPWLALAGPVFLVLNPRFFGEWANNPKDMPFAVFYFLSLCLIYHWRRSEKWGPLLILGLVIGVATCVRLLGLSLILIYALSVTYERFREKDLKKVLFSVIWQSGVLAVVVLLILMATWPFLRESPLLHGFRLLQLAADFPWNMPVLFNGQEIPGTELGLSYLPIWFFISTPLFILVLALAGVWFFLKKNDGSIGIFWVLVLIFHGLVYLALKPNVYDGVRHYLFLEPILSILSCLVFINMVQSAWNWKWTVVALVGVNALLVGWHMSVLHPFEYTYFNEAVGGLSGAAGKFETEYAGASYKEAVEWLENHETTDSRKIYHINTEGSAFQSAHYFLPYMEWTYLKDADYFIANTRWNKQDQVDPSKVIHVVEREGVPFTYVFKLR